MQRYPRTDPKVEPQPNPQSYSSTLFSIHNLHKRPISCRLQRYPQIYSSSFAAWEKDFLSGQVTRVPSQAKLLSKKRKLNCAVETHDVCRGAWGISPPFFLQPPAPDLQLRPLTPKEEKKRGDRGRTWAVRDNLSKNLVASSIIPIWTPFTSGDSSFRELCVLPACLHYDPMLIAIWLASFLFLLSFLISRGPVRCLVCHLKPWGA